MKFLPIQKQTMNIFSESDSDFFYLLWTNKIAYTKQICMSIYNKNQNLLGNNFVILLKWRVPIHRIKSFHMCNFFSLRTPQKACVMYVWKE